MKGAWYTAYNGITLVVLKETVWLSIVVLSTALKLSCHRASEFRVRLLKTSTSLASPSFLLFPLRFSSLLFAACLLPVLAILQQRPRICYEACVLCPSFLTLNTLASSLLGGIRSCVCMSTHSSLMLYSCYVGIKHATVIVSRPYNTLPITRLCSTS